MIHPLQFRMAFLFEEFPFNENMKCWQVGEPFQMNMENSEVHRFSWFRCPLDSCFLGFLVSWFLGSLMSWFLRSSVASFLRFCIPGSRSFKFSKTQRFNASKFQKHVRQLEGSDPILLKPHFVLSGRYGSHIHDVQETFTRIFLSFQCPPFSRTSTLCISLNVISKRIVFVLMLRLLLNYLRSPVLSKDK